MTTFSGKLVVEESGDAIEGLVVTLSHRKSANRKEKEVIQSDVTRSDGSFSLDSEEPGSDVVVEVYKSSSSDKEEPLATIKPPALGGRLQIPLSAEMASEGVAGHKALNLRMNAFRSFKQKGIDPIKNLRAEFSDLKKYQQKALFLLSNPKISKRRFFVDPQSESSEIKLRAVSEGIKYIGSESEKTPLARVKVPDNLNVGELDLAEEVSLDDAPKHISDHIKDKSAAGPVLRVPTPDCNNKTYVFSKLVSDSASSPETSSDRADHESTDDTEAPSEEENSDTDAESGTSEDNRHSKMLDKLYALFEEFEQSKGVRPTGSTLNKDLNAEISGGPADATAYHDFYSLNIAFENIWTSFVDGKAARLLRDSYQEAVKVMGGKHASGGIADFSEVSDLKEAMEQLRDAVAVRESASYTENGSSGDNDAYRTRRHPFQSSETPDMGRLERLLKGVEKALKTGYKFDVFAPHSYNFGVLVHYRQRWQPLSYQVGDLVGTIPLAPGQTQTVTKRHVIKKSRAVKEAERSVASRSFERSTTNRADAEIVEKATYSTNFSMSSSASIKANIAMVKIGASGSTKFTHNQSRESSETKKNFREAVRKSASEYRDEHSIEVSTSTESEAFSETVTELSNPNNELTMTYLFYELQRRYHVAEKLHQVTPVVLVALDVPPPDEIDEAWLLEHEWIVRRVLLDDIYVESLDILAEGLADAEIASHTMRAVLEGHSNLVQDLKIDVQTRKNAFEDARERLAKRISKGPNEQGIGEDLVEFFAGGSDDADIQKSKVEAAKKTLDWTEEDLARLTSELRSAASSLQKAAQEYLKSVRDLQRRRLAVDRLRLHVRQNILYYMQAVWSHTPPDQLFFELYDIEVVWPKTSGAPRIVNKKTVTEGIDESGDPIEKEVLEYRYPAPEMGDERPLHEIADVNRILGFKGNYVMLPLRESNALTDVMMQPYREDGNAIDPDDSAGVDPVEVLDKYRCRRDRVNLAGKRGNNLRFDPEKLKEDLTDYIENADSVAGEIITVPSGSLYIEALPGKRPLLEDFKLKHREIDAQAAAEDVRSGRLENLRWALRLEEGMRSDPEVDKNVHIETNSDGNTDVDVD